jgi:CheY-like chemotaxis protein
MGIPVLIVDDDDDIRDTLRLILEDEGYTVYEARDGKPALERLRTHPVGMVVLLDVQMPEMNGIQMLQTIEAETPLAARHAYILMSAQHRPLPTHLAHDLHGLGVPTLDKPFDLDTLLTEVAAAAKHLSHRTPSARSVAPLLHGAYFGLPPPPPTPR